MVTDKSGQWRRRAACRLSLLLLCSGALSACAGEIEPGKDNGNGAPYIPGQPIGPNGATSGTGAPVGTDPEDPRIAQRIWRLTPAQFNDEVRRLFGQGAPQVSIPESAAEYGITNIAANGVVDLGNASIFADGAREIATWVVAQRNTTTRCTNYGQEACVDSFLRWSLDRIE